MADPRARTDNDKESPLALMAKAAAAIEQAIVDAQESAGTNASRSIHAEAVGESISSAEVPPVNSGSSSDEQQQQRKRAAKSNPIAGTTSEPIVGEVQEGETLQKRKRKTSSSRSNSNVKKMHLQEQVGRNRASSGSDFGNHEVPVMSSSSEERRKAVNAMLNEDREGSVDANKDDKKEAPLEKKVAVKKKQSKVKEPALPSNVKMAPGKKRKQLKAETDTADSSAKASADKKRKSPVSLPKEDSTKFNLRCKLTTVKGQLTENPHFTHEQAKAAAKREYNRRNAARARLRGKYLLEELQETVQELTERANELAEENSNFKSEINVLRKNRKQKGGGNAGPFQNQAVPSISPEPAGATKTQPPDDQFRLAKEGGAASLLQQFKGGGEILKSPPTTSNAATLGPGDAATLHLLEQMLQAKGHGGFLQPQQPQDGLLNQQQVESFLQQQQTGGHLHQKQQAGGMLLQQQAGGMQHQKQQQRHLDRDAATIATTTSASAKPEDRTTKVDSRPELDATSMINQLMLDQIMQTQGGTTLLQQQKQNQQAQRQPQEGEETTTKSLPVGNAAMSQHLLDQLVKAGNLASLLQQQHRQPNTMDTSSIIQTLLGGSTQSPQLPAAPATDVVGQLVNAICQLKKEQERKQQQEQASNLLTRLLLGAANGRRDDILGSSKQPAPAPEASKQLDAATLLAMLKAQLPPPGGPKP
jgi:hypothetical protein